jgi:spermidine synthase
MRSQRPPYRPGPLAGLRRALLRGALAAAAAALLVAGGCASARDDLLVHVERSQYQDIYVFDSATRRCMRFGGGADALDQSCLNLGQPEHLEFRYTRAMTAVALLWRPVPRRILVIGLGGGSIPTALATLLPQTRIDAVELDPSVIAVAERYFGFRQSDRVRAHAQDGAEFVRGALARGERYDAILLDAFDHEGIPPSLFSEAFLADVRRLLAPGGVFMANTFAGSNSYATESARAEAVFGTFLNIRLGDGDGGNRLLVAAPGALPERDALLARCEQMRPSLDRIGAAQSWIRSWRFAGRDWVSPH